MTTTVALKNEKSRYEVAVDGQSAGVLEYTSQGDVLDLHHTEVYENFAGQGVAGELVKQSLDQIRATGKKIIPSCSYVKSWIDKHPEYSDMIAG